MRPNLAEDPVSEKRKHAALGQRIQSARQNHRPFPVAQGQLAERIGVSQARLSNWERGHHAPSLTQIRQIADALSLDSEWLRTGIGYQSPEPSAELVGVDRSNVRFVPVHGAITAGLPADSPSQIVDCIEMRDWGGHFERWGRIIEGDSMEPELLPGDIVVLEDRRWEPGHVVHAFDKGEDTIKVAAQDKSGVWLLPINPDYAPIDAESWHVKGVCVAYVRREPGGAVLTREFPGGMKPKLLRAVPRPR